MWTAEHVGIWLGSIGFKGCAEKFMANEITGECLLEGMVVIETAYAWCHTGIILE